MQSGCSDRSTTPEGYLGRLCARHRAAAVAIGLKFSQGWTVRNSEAHLIRYRKFCLPWPGLCGSVNLLADIGNFVESQLNGLEFVRTCFASATRGAELTKFR
jgi:hypothetical protein